MIGMSGFEESPPLCSKPRQGLNGSPASLSDFLQGRVVVQLSEAVPTQMVLGRGIR